MAGVAASFGLDPVAFLALAPEDAPFAVAALKVAVRRRQEESLGELDYVAARTAYHTVSGFANVMRGVVRAFSKRG